MRNESNGFCNVKYFNVSAATIKKIKEGTKYEIVINVVKNRKTKK